MSEARVIPTGQILILTGVAQEAAGPEVGATRAEEVLLLSQPLISLVLADASGRVESGTLEAVGPGQPQLTFSDPACDYQLLGVSRPEVLDERLDQLSYIVGVLGQHAAVMGLGRP